MLGYPGTSAALRSCHHCIFGNELLGRGNKLGPVYPSAANLGNPAFDGVLARLYPLFIVLILDERYDTARSSEIVTSDLFEIIPVLTPFRGDRRTGMRVKHPSQILIKACVHVFVHHQQEHCCIQSPVTGKLGDVAYFASEFERRDDLVGEKRADNFSLPQKRQHLRDWCRFWCRANVAKELSD